MCLCDDDVKNSGGGVGGLGGGLEVNGAECEQQSCVVSVGFQNNLSATVSDRGTSKSCYCCGCQTEIQDSTPIPLSDIYLFFQLLDSNPNKH